jgi:hypothetical protein
MVESMAEQYRAQATRYDALADQAVDPAREALYRRLEHGYLTLVDLARPPSIRFAEGPTPGKRLRPAISGGLRCLRRVRATRSISRRGP